MKVVRFNDVQEFSDNPWFKKWLGDTIFGATYQRREQQVSFMG